MVSLVELSKYSGVATFVVGLPATVGTFFQVLKTRREAREVRQGLVYSANCLEFLKVDGTFVNLVPLETLHSLPKPGDIVLLPGSGEAAGAEYGAYRVIRIEHIYAQVPQERRKDLLPGQARLAKAVAHVELLTAQVPAGEAN